MAGVVIERCVIRFLYGRPLETLLATFGISLVLQQAVRSGFGPTNREVDTPAFMSGAFELGGMQITLNRLAIMVFAICGLRSRCSSCCASRASACAPAPSPKTAAWHPRWAFAPNAIDALTFGLGSGIAGLAGVALSQIDNVSPNLGQGYIIDSFLVVVFGGVGNLWGTLIGALSIGMANKFLEPFAGAVLGKIALLVFIILFIQKRPRGPVRAQGPRGRGMNMGEANRFGFVGPLGAGFLALLVVSAVAVPAANLIAPSSSALHVSTATMALAGKYLSYALLAVGARSRLGLLRHSFARPWRLLRARRLCDGHVSHAPDRLARRLRQSAAAGFHGVPQLDEAALVLVRLRSVSLCRHDGACSCPACLPSSSAGSPSARA